MYTQRHHEKSDGSFCTGEEEKGETYQDGFGEIHFENGIQVKAICEDHGIEWKIDPRTGQDIMMDKLNVNSSVPLETLNANPSVGLDTSAVNSLLVGEVSIVLPSVATTPAISSFVRTCQIP